VTKTSSESFRKILLDSRSHFGNHENTSDDLRPYKRLWRSCRRATRSPWKMKLGMVGISQRGTCLGTVLRGA